MGQRRIGRWFGAGLTLAGALAGGCGLAQRNYAAERYKLQPLLIQPIDKDRIRVGFFDEDGVDRIELCDWDGGLIKTFRPGKGTNTYSPTIKLPDDSFIIRAYDSLGDLTEARGIIPKKK